MLVLVHQPITGLAAEGNTFFASKMCETFRTLSICYVYATAKMPFIEAIIFSGPYKSEAVLTYKQQVAQNKSQYWNEFKGIIVEVKRRGNPYIKKLDGVDTPIKVYPLFISQRNEQSTKSSVYLVEYYLYGSHYPEWRIGTVVYQGQENAWDE